MRIAILGWGSLLWDPRPEFDEQHDHWKFDGPELKIEFSRVSDSRKGALTLVIDENNGSMNQVAWCLSKRSEIDDAACDLRCREATICKKIRRIVVCQTEVPGDAAGKSILDWALRMKLDAVVWTALESNFMQKTANKRFNTEAALAYVKNLPPLGKAKAFEYVTRAPDFVKTPLRTALESSPWFNS